MILSRNSNKASCYFLELGQITGRLRLVMTGMRALNHLRHKAFKSCVHTTAFGLVMTENAAILVMTRPKAIVCTQLLNALCRMWFKARIPVITRRSRPVICPNSRK